MKSKHGFGVFLGLTKLLSVEKVLKNITERAKLIKKPVLKSSSNSSISKYYFRLPPQNRKMLSESPCIQI